MVRGPTRPPSPQPGKTACWRARRRITSPNISSRGSRAIPSGSSGPCRGLGAFRPSTRPGGRSRASRRCCGCARASGLPARGRFASRTSYWQSASVSRRLTKSENEGRHGSSCGLRHSLRHAQTIRRSGSRRHDHRPLHVVSAWASEQGLALGQRAVDGKSNEIVAIPELLETLHLEGCIVTLDAMGCQKDIAAQIRAKGADYLLVLKANHGRAFGAVREQFERTCFGRGCKRRPVFDAFDEGHGRLVRRRVFVAPAVQDLEPLHGWPDLRAVFAVETIRSVNGTGQVEAEIRYFLTSCSDAPAVLVRAIRRHWRVENALHWVLDVTFREDDSRVRDRTAARNFALLRKIALNLVAQDQGTQTSLRGRRKKAAWNDGYMLQIIAHQAHA